MDEKQHWTPGIVEFGFALPTHWNIDSISFILDAEDNAVYLVGTRLHKTKLDTPYMPVELRN